MNPPDFETNRTGTFAELSTQRLKIFRLRETVADLIKVADELMPGIGHVACDIGFINDTLIESRALLRELEDEEHESAQSAISEPDKSAVSDADDEPGQPDQSDEGSDRSGQGDGSRDAGTTDPGTR